MRRKIVVAVIDSGIDKTDRQIRNYDIEDVYYDSSDPNRFKYSYEGKVNIHGTEIIKVLFREAPDIHVISIQTLQENNRCTLSSIIESIRYCISLGVDIINLSLGSCLPNARRLDDLMNVCQEAVDKGIAVFAADSNKQGAKSYPANFDNVIGVNTIDGMDDYCEIRFREKTIVFSENYVFVPDRVKCIIRKGNSYLCPMLAGIYCRFLEDKENCKDTMTQFISYLEQFCKKEIISKVYFNKRSEKDLNLICRKKVAFFADDMDFNNMSLIEFYSENNYLSCCHGDILNKKNDEIEEYVGQFDMLFIGTLSNDFLSEHQDSIRHLIHAFIKKKKDIVSILPIVSTFDRVQLAKTQGSVLKSFYK